MDRLRKLAQDERETARLYCDLWLACDRDGDKAKQIVRRVNDNFNVSHNHAMEWAREIVLAGGWGEYWRRAFN